MCPRSTRLLLPCTMLILAGAAAAADTPPRVEVCRPVSREVADYADFTGRAEAVQTVEVRARVSGMLEKVAFRDGATVRQDEVLFELDPRPYQADVDRADAEAARSEAQLTI